MIQQGNSHTLGIRTAIILFLIIGTAAVPVSGATGSMGITISADGDQSYYLGEKIVLRGQSPQTDIVYLFLTGPDLPAEGIKLTSPDTAIVSGDPDSFTVVKTKPDKTWEYTWYTANLPFQAGTYSIYATSRPVTMDQPDSDATRIGIILKKPFLTADISSKSITRGQPFSVTGTAVGTPPDVQAWIIGDSLRVVAKTPVSADDTFEYNVLPGVSASLPAGQYYLIVQHPMADNTFDFDISEGEKGEYFVRNQKLNEGWNLFRLTSPGNLPGSDTADALAIAISDQESGDTTLTCDTYSIIPFQVTGAGSGSGIPVPDADTGTGVTIAAIGDKSYYLGEKVELYGRNTETDTTYLSLTGPNLPDQGAKLTAPLEPAVSGKPDSFTEVMTRPDNAWDYIWYTANLPLDAGTYTLYAGSQPDTIDQADSAAASIGIIVKKPFITTEISPSEVVKGQPFSISGYAEGNPPEVQIWIIGYDHYTITTQPVNDDAAYEYSLPPEVSATLPAGRYYLIAQHPMVNNEFDIVLGEGEPGEDYIRDIEGNNLIKMFGKGGLRGSDAAYGLTLALADKETNDKTYAADTHSIVPFLVTEA